MEAKQHRCWLPSPDVHVVAGMSDLRGTEAFSDHEAIHWITIGS